MDKQLIIFGMLSLTGIAIGVVWGIVSVVRLMLDRRS